MRIKLNEFEEYVLNVDNVRVLNKNEFLGFVRKLNNIARIITKNLSEETELGHLTQNPQEPQEPKETISLLDVSRRRISKTLILTKPQVIELWKYYFLNNYDWDGTMEKLRRINPQVDQYNKQTINSYLRTLRRKMGIKPQEVGLKSYPDRGKHILNFL